MNIKVLLSIILFFIIIIYNIDIVNEERNDKVIYDVSFKDFKLIQTDTTGLSFEVKSKKGYFGEKHILENVFLLKKKGADFEFITADTMKYSHNDWAFSGKVNYLFKNIDITAYKLVYMENENKIYGNNFIFKDEKRMIKGQDFHYDIDLEVLQTSFTNLIMKE